MKVVCVTLLLLAVSVICERKPGAEVVRLSNVDLDTFLEYMARHEPVVVTDVATNWAIKDKWTCEYLTEKYAEQDIILWVAGDKSKTKFKDGWDKIHGKIEDGLDGGRDPTRAAFAWEVVIEGYTKLPPKDYQELVMDRGNFDVPYFLPNSTLNMGMMLNRMEVFVGFPGSGAATHVDSICPYIFSTQLSGTKKWLLSPYPGVGEAFGGADELIDKDRENYSPMYETVLQTGETLFFPPGFVHTTIGQEGCAVSTSFQFMDPYPASYVRNHLEILTHAEEVSACFRTDWNGFITGESDSNTDIGGARHFAKKRCAELDLDKDGVVTHEEFANFRRPLESKEFAIYLRESLRKHGAHGSVDARPNPAAQQKMNEMMSNRTDIFWKGFKAYHDTNKDGVVSVPEIQKNLVTWFHELADSRHNMTSKDREESDPEFARLADEADNMPAAKKDDARVGPPNVRAKHDEHDPILGFNYQEVTQDMLDRLLEQEAPMRLVKNVKKVFKDVHKYSRGTTDEVPVDPLKNVKKVKSARGDLYPLPPGAGPKIDKADSNADSSAGKPIPAKDEL